MLDLATGASCLGPDPVSLFHAPGSKQLLVKELWEQSRWICYSNFHVSNDTGHCHCRPTDTALPPCLEPVEPTLCGQLASHTKGLLWRIYVVDCIITLR